MLRLIKLVIVIFIASSLNLHSSEISIPKEGWGINRGGGKGAQLAFDKTPAGGVALKVKALDEKNSTVVFPVEELRKQRKNWPDTFSGLSGYFWGTGKYTNVQIIFFTEEGKFSASVKYDHVGWKKKYISILLNRHDRNAKFSPSSVQKIIFRSYIKNESKEIGFGDLTWEEAGQVLRKASYGRTGVTRKCTAAPVIDGNLQDMGWESVPGITLKNCAGGRGNLPSRNTWFKTCFDNKYFYLSASCFFEKGTKLKCNYKDHDSRNLYKEESIEIFIYPDIDPRLYYHFILSPTNVKAEAANVFDQIDDRIRRQSEWNGKWLSGTKIYDDHWDVEVAIPWETLDSKDVPGIVQFQFMRTDNTGKTKEHPLWSPVRSRPWHGFGTLALLDKEQAILNIDFQQLKRRDNGEFEIEGSVNSSQRSGKVDFEIFFSDPYQPTQKFMHSIELVGEKTPFSTIIKPRALVNGFHQVVIFGKGENHNMPAGCNMFPFSQTILGNVAFDDPVFLPAVKDCKWLEGEFILKDREVISISADASERTLKTAMYLAEKLYGFSGINFEVVKGSKGRISLVVDKAKVASKTIDSDEAYYLSINPDCTTLTGEGEAGLYYAVRTLLQLCAAPKKSVKSIPCVEIKDWPTLPVRIFHATFRGNKKSRNGTKGYELAKMKDMIERHIAGAKYNTMPMAFLGTNINFPSFPDVHHPDKFTVEDIRELADFAREHFVDPAPAVSWGSHTAMVSIFPEMRDKDSRNHSHIDFAHPDKFEVTKKLFGDLIEAFGKPLKYFHTRNDELWKSMTKDDFMYKGKSRQDWFYQHLTEEHKIITSYGLRMAMFSDMLEPKHNGGKPLYLCKVADRLPRDIIISSWSHPPVEFAKKGFDTWREGNGFTADYRPLKASTKGFGYLGYNNIDTLFNYSDNNRWLFYGWHSAMQAANYAWNKEEKGVLPMPDWTMRYMPNLVGTFSKVSNPKASGRYQVVELKADEKIKEGYSFTGQKDIGNIPMQLAPVMVTPEKNISIAFEKAQNIAGIFVLNNVIRGDSTAVKRLKKLARTSVPYGIIIGWYKLLYSDGTEAQYPVRLGRTISFYSGIDPRSRFVKEARAVYAVAPDYSKGFTQFEFVNPEPEKAVKGINIICQNEDAPILVAALTLQFSK